ncbi:MAG: hypothetical protein RL347_344 [Actinomycetota bacterium]|jgi:hypothetical protein
MSLDQLTGSFETFRITRSLTEHSQDANRLIAVGGGPALHNALQLLDGRHLTTLPRSPYHALPVDRCADPQADRRRLHGMRRTPFDDPRAFRRRWAHLTPEQLRAEATRDPLLFAADHVSIFDRHEGSVVVLADLDAGLPPTMIVIPGGPPDPTEEDCLGLLAGVVSRIDEGMDDSMAVPLGDICVVRRLGIVTHRLGASMVNDIDRRWMRALGLVSVALGIEIIGVMARTRSGALVRVPDAAAAA